MNNKLVKNIITELSKEEYDTVDIVVRTKSGDVIVMPGFTKDDGGFRDMEASEETGVLKVEDTNGTQWISSDDIESIRI